MRLYFDTETTGIPDKRLPWNHPRQPAIVSIAWVLVDEPDWHEGAVHNHFILPEGWEIDEAGPAFGAHHITNDKCKAEGIPISQVMKMFTDSLGHAREACAYNIQFDIDMILIACERGGAHPLDWPNWPKRLDIMPLAQIYCQMPPTDRMKAAGRNGYKPPKLSEALRIICKEEFPNAHDALADVRATIKIHRALEEFRSGGRKDA